MTLPLKHRRELAREASCLSQLPDGDRLQRYMVAYVIPPGGHSATNRRAKVSGEILVARKIRFSCPKYKEKLVFSYEKWW